MLICLSGCGQPDDMDKEPMAEDVAVTEEMSDKEVAEEETEDEEWDVLYDSDAEGVLIGG